MFSIVSITLHLRKLLCVPRSRRYRNTSSIDDISFAIETANIITTVKPYINDQTNVYKVEKCSKSSTDIRNEGNKLYNLSLHDKKVHLQTLMCFTKCIAYAPNGSEELAEGYGNRSMLLHHLGQYESCIIDIDRALSITQSNLLQIKLLTRKVECIALGHLHLHDDNRSLDISEILKEAKDLVNKLDGNQIKIKDCCNILIKNAEELVGKLSSEKADLKKKDLSGKAKFPDFASKGEIPGASDALALSYNTEFGRHITATREIKAGEILMIEDGFVHPNPANAYMTCSHCAEGTYNGIPCDTCVFAIYCSEKCKQDAWTSYHDKECTKYDYYKILKHFLEPQTNDYDKFVVMLFLLRRVLIFTLKKTDDNSVDNLYSKFFGTGENEDEPTKGFKINDRLDGRTLEALGSLASHINEREALMMYMPFVYLLSIDVLPMKSDMLSDYPKMLRLVTQAVAKFLVNTYAIGLGEGSCVCKTDQYGAEHQGDCITRRGIMAAPFCSLINHSCVNNASGVIVNGKMVLFANRPIKPDEQVFIDYGTPGLESTASQRQHNISARYHFTCNCEACRENWPVITFEESVKLNEVGFSEFIKNFENFDPNEIGSKMEKDIENILKDGTFDAEKLSLDVGVDLVKNKKGVKMDFEHAKAVEPDFLFNINVKLYAASKTIHNLFAKNSIRTSIIKSELIRSELKSFILKEVFCYDRKHFNVSDNCSKK